MRRVTELVEGAKLRARRVRQKAREEAEKFEGTEGEDFVFRLGTQIGNEMDWFGEELEKLRVKKEQELSG